MAKWVAYRFTKNVYDKFVPMHLKRICSAIDVLTPDIDFGGVLDPERRWVDTSSVLRYVSGTLAAHIRLKS